MESRMNSWQRFASSSWRWDVYDNIFPGEKTGIGDIDGVLERNGNVLIIETKHTNAILKTGQRLMLRNMHRMGCTVLVLFGEVNCPRRALWLVPDDDTCNSVNGIDDSWLRDFLEHWYSWASCNKRPYAIDFTKLFTFGGEL